MKITVVGGGSTYTPELVDGLARMSKVGTSEPGSASRGPRIDELVLTDPAETRLETVGGFARRLLAGAGSPVSLTTSTDLDAALDGADIVVIQLRVGGQAARITDETIPLECGCVGQETTGAGGLAKALRTVPVVLDVARKVRRRVPNAWIVDFTNPVGIVTRALLDDGHRAVGLCNNALTNQRHCAKLLGVDPETVRLDHVGLNHLTWELGVHLDGAGDADGTDVLPKLLADHGDEIAAGLELPRRMLDILGAIPSGYLRYFYAHDRIVAEECTAPTRGQRVAEIERELLELYADPAVDTKPELLTQRGGAYYSEAALGLIAALCGDEGSRHVADVRNAGTLPFLPDEAVVEVPCRIDADGAHPARRAGRPLPSELAALVSRVAAYEELAVDAALRGGRDPVFRALLAHPLIGQVDQAEHLTDRLADANAEHLDWVRAEAR